MKICRYIFYFAEEIKMKGRVKKTTERRVVAIMILFSIFASYLLYNIFQLGVLKYDYYRDKTYDR